MLKAGSDVNQHCLCFVRIIQNMEEHLSHPLAWRFIDLTDTNSLDNDAQERLSNLRDNKVIGALNRLNVSR